MKYYNYLILLIELKIFYLKVYRKLNFRIQYYTNNILSILMRIFLIKKGEFFQKYYKNKNFIRIQVQI